jgi:large subunit ribosomal protein L22
MVRGKKVEDAINILKFTPTPAAKAVAKLIKSASANAENNFQMDPAELKVVYIAADEARTLKRYRPQSRGRYSPILKRATHVKVLVSEEEK